MTLARSTYAPSTSTALDGTAPHTIFVRSTAVADATLTAIAQTPCKGKVVNGIEQEETAGCDMALFMEMNSGEPIAWATVGAAQVGVYDSSGHVVTPGTFSLKQILAHELGHWLGLGNNTLGLTVSLMHNAIDWGDDNDALRYTDITALTWVYGTETE